MPRRRAASRFLCYSLLYEWLTSPHKTTTQELQEDVRLAGQPSLIKSLFQFNLQIYRLVLPDGIFGPEPFRAPRQYLAIRSNPLLSTINATSNLTELFIYDLRSDVSEPSTPLITSSQSFPATCADGDHETAAIASGSIFVANTSLSFNLIVNNTAKNCLHC